MSNTNILPLVIITPIYEDFDAANKLFLELADAFSRAVYIVAVDDGSVSQPLDISGIQAAKLDGIVIKLKRNMGHQRAIAVGLNYVAHHLPQAPVIVIMDSDGEDIPSTINELILPLKFDNVDVVVAQRKSRIETLRFRTFYLFYKWLFSLLTGRKIGFGNFMALKPRAVRRLVAMQELWIHVAGCVLSSKLRISTCPLNRGPRYAGQSKMSFVGLALHGFKGVMVFAEDVLVRVGIACVFVAILSLIGGLTAISLKILGFATPGWFSIALGILVLVFLQTGALSLMTLMLTGVIKGGVATHTNYEEFIEMVTPVLTEIKRC